MIEINIIQSASAKIRHQEAHPALMLVGKFGRSPDLTRHHIFKPSQFITFSLKII